MSQIFATESHEQLRQRHRALAGLLELIFRTCELSPEQHDAIRRHYTEKIECLKECLWLRQYDLHLGPQGSAALGTSVRPLERKHGEHDVDLVLKVIARVTAFTSAELHRRIGDQLRRHYKSILQAIRYGWQLDYAETERFHFDVIGAIPWVHGNRPMVAVCDWKVSGWKESNPEDYIRDFLKLAEQLPYIDDPEYQTLLEGKITMFNSARTVTVDPLPENTLMKLPLQRGVQLTKRHRDVWFSKRKALDRRTPSIILTTILWQAYERHVVGKVFPTVFSVLEAMADHLDDPAIIQTIVDHRGTPRYFLANPTVAGENLVARWNEPARAHEAQDFFAWVKDYQAFVRTLAGTEGSFRLQPLLGEALGKETVEPVFKQITAALRPDRGRPATFFHAGIGLTTSAVASAAPVRAHTFHGSP